MSGGILPVIVVVLAIAMLTLAVLHIRARCLYRTHWRIEVRDRNHTQPAGAAGKVRALGSPYKTARLCGRCVQVPGGQERTFRCHMNERCGLYEGIEAGPYRHNRHRL